jgi:hypothetical protein
MARSLDVLTLVAATRAGGRDRHERSYLDFKVGRRRLSSLLDAGDRASVLGWLTRADERRFARQLLLRAAPELASGRVPLYLCAECGDLGCGCVAVRVEREGDVVVWSELGPEGADPAAATERPWPVPERLRFDAEAYRLLLWPFV